MPVSLTRNFDSLTELALVTRDDMREIGLLARERIVTRTRRGLDAENVPFQPYSAAYGEQKRAALGTSTVNLTVSGNMLNHLTIVEITDHSVTLGWNQ
jgi:hypothetical protein